MEREIRILLAAITCAAGAVMLGTAPGASAAGGLDWNVVKQRMCELGRAGGHWLGAGPLAEGPGRALTAFAPVLAAVFGPCDGPGAHRGRPAGFQSGASNLSGSGRIIEHMEAIPEFSAPTGGPDPDAALVTAARKGDRDAFAALYRRHAGWLLPTLWRLTGGDRHKAEDLLQDAFVHGWKKLDQLREPAAFGGWMKRLAVNLALAERRRLRPVPDDGLPEPAAPEPPWPAADLDLERAIARLPERARQVLVLFHLEGFAHGEIAKAMKVETGTTKAQLHRARALLKEMLS